MLFQICMPASRSVFPSISYYCRTINNPDGTGARSWKSKNLRSLHFQLLKLCFSLSTDTHLLDEVSAYLSIQIDGYSAVLLSQFQSSDQCVSYTVT